MVDERMWRRVRKFRLEYKAGDTWKTVLEGETIGKNYSREFSPVKAQHVRLNILEATEGPTIWEFHLFGPQDK